MSEKPPKTPTNPMITSIATPLSGQNKLVGLRLPVELANYFTAQADDKVSNVSFEIRGVLIQHLRNIGVMAPAHKGAKP